MSCVLVATAQLFLMVPNVSGNEALQAQSSNISDAKNLTAEQLFKAAETAAVENRLTFAIELLTALTNDPNVEYRAEARVRLARIFFALKQYRLAAIWFQKLLDEKPNVVAARVELARILALLGDDSAAAGQLRRAAAVPGISDPVSRALLRVGANIRSNAPLGGSLRIGIAPDSNINRATDAQLIDIFGMSFDLNDNARAQSGVGLTINANAFARRKITDGGWLVGQISVDTDLYKVSTFNDVNVTLALGPEIRSGRATYRSSLIGGRRWLGSNSLYDFYGLSASAQRSISQSAQITLSVSIFNFDYKTRSDLSGPIYSIGAAYERAISSRLSTKVGIAAARIDAAASSNANTNLNADWSLSRDAGRITLFSKIGVGRVAGDAAFIAFGKARRDLSYDGEIGVVFRQITAFGLSPLVRAKYTRNVSNIALFNFRRNRFEFALTKTF